METYEICLYLMSCALNGTKPSLSQPLDMEPLWQFAERHSVAPTVAKPLPDHNLIDDPHWLKIWHAPLKGIVVNPLYPFYGMRDFADNDMVVESGNQELLVEKLATLGYQVENIHDEVHLAFLKEPLLNFQLHHRLFGSAKRLEAITRYYEDVKSRLVPDGRSPYSYRFTDDDFYVYFIAHAYKHFSGAGTGVRLFADVYVYLTRVPTDEAYVRSEFEKLGILPFAEAVAGVSRKLMACGTIDGAGLTEAEKALLFTAIDAGTYGTSEQLYVSKYNDYLLAGGKNSRAAYYYHRLFPNVERFKNAYPFLYRHKLLHPVIYIRRPFRALFHRRGGKIIKEIKTVHKIDTDHPDGGK